MTTKAKLLLRFECIVEREIHLHKVQFRTSLYAWPNRLCKKQRQPDRKRGPGSIPRAGKLDSGFQFGLPKMITSLAWVNDLS